MAEEKITIREEAVGSSGIVSSGGIYREEYLEELIGVDGSKKYDKMRRSDPQVRKLLAATLNPIKSATWTIEGEDEKQVELIKQILFKDFPFGFKQKLNEILTFVVFGHSVFEIIHENKNNSVVGSYTGLKDLAYRSAKTLTRWNRDSITGKVLTIEQDTNGDVSKLVTLPVEFLLIFLNEHEGDDNGFSLLRPLYGCYKRKLLNLQLQAIGNERHAIGTVVASVPADTYANDEEMKKLIIMLDDFTSHESSYIIKPDNVTIDVKSNNFDGSKLEASIKAEDERMAGAWIATFLELGTGGNGGAFALGKDLSDFFLGGLLYIADQVTEVFNNQLIPHLVQLNFGVQKEYPKLKHNGIDDKAGKELAEVVQILLGSNAIQADEKLDAWLRKIYKLPEADPDTVREKPEPVLPLVPPKLNSKIQFSEKTPRGLIETSSEEVQALMQKNIKAISEKMIADVMNRYADLPENQKLKAVSDLKAGKTAIYRQELKAKLTEIAVQSLDQAKKEVPGFENIKFSGKEFQMADSRLPIRVKTLLELQSREIVDKQAQEIESRVAFQFQSSESSTNDPDIIRQDLNKATDELLTGPSVIAGSANTAATVINDTRQAFFNVEEVLAKIASFTFMNPSPETAICQFLAGKTFNKDDAEAWRYQTPLHHNCKTWIRPNLETSKNKPVITDGGIHPPANAVKSITLSEKGKENA